LECGEGLRARPTMWAESDCPTASPSGRAMMRWEDRLRSFAAEGGHRAGIDAGLGDAIAPIFRCGAVSAPFTGPLHREGAKGVATL
jgi:hypothetical protein